MAGADQPDAREAVHTVTQTLRVAKHWILRCAQNDKRVASESAGQV